MTKRKATVGVRPKDAAPEIGGLDENGELPVFFPALAVEGMATSDRRTIKPGALSHRALPWSILAQYRNPGRDGGHAGAEVIGHMKELWRKPGPEVTSRETGEPFPDGTFVWQGRGVVDPETPGGRLAAKGHLRGNSVDLSELDFDQELAENGQDAITINSAKMAATTLCPIPAFADAYVSIGEEEEALAASGDDPSVRAAAVDHDLIEFGSGPEFASTVSAQYEAMVAAGGLPPFRAAELGDTCGLCSVEDDEADWTETAPGEFSPSPAKRRRAYARGLAIKGKNSDGSDAAYPIENQADLDKAATMVGLGKDANGTIRAHIKKAARKLGLKLPPSLTADGAPTLPSLALFSDPKLATYTPITIGAARDDGRREIVGHIAPWNECHTSYAGTCVRPPHSRTDYARFMTGGVRVDDAGTERIAAVGHITMSREGNWTAGHADGGMSLTEAVAHYDHTGTAVADVAAGEDAHGIWIHGLTRQGLTDAELDVLLASAPSGDWRGYQGNLELCAVLVVNTPGYPVVRSRVASGEPLSLVAAGANRTALADGTNITTSLAAIREVVMRCLGEFFDPDNDGDIDRPLDTDDDAGDGHSDGDQSTPPTSPAKQPPARTASLAARRSAAALVLRRAGALEEIGVPFE